MNALIKGLLSENTMNLLEKIKQNSFVKRVYETPYRLKLYFIAYKNYKKTASMLTQEDICRIKALKDIHKGERCFIVGTGPSLNQDDLLSIRNEICFTANSGYRILKKCGLFPNYFISTDYAPIVLEEMIEVLNDNCSTLVFSEPGRHDSNPRLIALPIDDRPITRFNSWVNLISKKMFPIGKFSTDLSRVVYAGKTVMCIAMQIAAYMGFKTIYLIGMDMDYTGKTAYSNMVEDRKQEVEYIYAKRISDDMLYQIEEFANDAKRKGVEIYNATRGGKLECFERVILEDVL